MEDKIRSKKKKTIGCTVDDELNNSLVEMAKETHIKKADLIRIAAANLVEARCNEPVIMMNMVGIMQDLNDVKKFIPKEQFDKIQYKMNNIMKLKGGK